MSLVLSLTFITPLNCLGFQDRAHLGPRRIAWHKEMSCFSVTPILDCGVPIQHKIHLLPVMEQLRYRHQAKLQEGVGKGRKESHCKGWHQLSTLLGSSQPLVFLGLVHSLMKNSQWPCAPACNSRTKKRNSIFLFTRVQLWRSEKNPLRAFFKASFSLVPFRWDTERNYLLQSLWGPAGDNPCYFSLGCKETLCWGTSPQPEHAEELWAQLPWIQQWPRADGWGRA